MSLYERAYRARGRGSQRRRAGGLVVPRKLSTHLSLPGTSNNNASAADSPALSVTGDFDGRVRSAPTDWSHTSVQGLIAKFALDPGTRSWYLRLATSGRPTFLGSIDGSTAAINATATATPAFVDGSPGWIRVTRVAATGVVTFYTHPDQVAEPAAAAWTQLGDPVADDAGALFDTTSVVKIGSQSSGVADNFAGRFFFASIRDGIDGTVVARADFVGKPPEARSVADPYGNTWTLNGTAKLSA